jgi:hypothetical protein
MTAMNPMAIGTSRSADAEPLDCGVDGCVVDASVTVNDASALDGKYDSEPAKLAVTVKSPPISGFQVYVNMPFALLAVVPMVR